MRSSGDIFGGVIVISWAGIVIPWIVISAILIGYGMGLSWFETAVRKVSYDMGSNPSMIAQKPSSERTSPIDTRSSCIYHSLAR
jgi:hypothetical protein